MWNLPSHFNIWGPLHTTRLRARDHCTSSTLIGGKGRSTGPSSLHTLLEGSTDEVNARWMGSLHGFPTWHQMDHVTRSLGIKFKNHFLEVSLPHIQETMALQNLKTVDLWNSIMCEYLASIKVHWNSIVWGSSHTTLEGLWPHYMILEVSWDGLWTLLLGSHQFHGHGSWLMCKCRRVNQPPPLAMTTG